MPTWPALGPAMFFQAPATSRRGSVLSTSATGAPRIAWIAAIATIVVLAAGWYHEAANRRQESVQTQQRLSELESRQQSDAATIPVGTSGGPGRELLLARMQGRLNTAGASAGGGAMPTAAQIKRNKAGLRARLESRFATDGSDPRWAQGTEATALEAIADPTLAPLTSPADSDMQCARTMCRMEFTFDSEGDASDWADYYPLGMSKALPLIQSQMTRLPDGRTQLVMYGYRDPKAQPVQ